MLDIKDVEHILGISYPTALAYAKKHGEYIDGKWYFTSATIAARIKAEKTRVAKMEERLQLKLAIRIME